MKRDTPGFPLFNRIVVLVISGGLLLGLMIAIATPQIREDLDFATGFVFAVCAMMGCFGIWLGLFFRPRTAKELAEEAAFPSPDQPKISPRALAYRFTSVSKSAAVLIDPETELIHFQNCHVPRKLLASAQPWFSCPITEIKGVHVFRYRGESLTIVTAEGKALIPATSDGYEQLRQTLKQLVPRNESGFSSDHPMMGMVYVAGALLGLFAGVMLTPKNANDSTLGLFAVAGAVSGVVLLYLLVWVSDRHLKIGLAQPIGFAMCGAFAGLLSHNVLRPLVGWDPAMAFLAAGAVIGCLFGIFKVTREQRK